MGVVVVLTTSSRDDKGKVSGMYLRFNLWQNKRRGMVAQVHESTSEFANLLPQLWTVLCLSHVHQQVPKERHLGIDFDN